MVLLSKVDTKKRNPLLEAELVSSFFGKCRGLMFRKKPTPLIFCSKDDEFVPLHMWFVFFSIDVLYLDKDKRIIEIKEHFRPFCTYVPRMRSRYVIELPKYSVAKFKLQVGDLLHFEEYS